MTRPLRGSVITHQRNDGLTTYMLRISAYGERHLVRLGHEEEGMTPALAERRRQQIVEQIKAGVWKPSVDPPVEQPSGAAQAPTFHEVATAFLRRKSLVVAVNTRADLRWRLTHHLLPYFAEMRVSAIDNDAVFGYLDHKLKQRERVIQARDAGTPLVDAAGVALRPLSNTSINMTLATLAAMLDEPECEPWIQRNPARGKDKRLKTFREKGNFLEVDQLNALLAAANASTAGSDPPRSAPDAPASYEMQGTRLARSQASLASRSAPRTTTSRGVPRPRSPLRSAALRWLRFSGSPARA